MKVRIDITLVDSGSERLVASEVVDHMPDLTLPKIEQASPTLCRWLAGEFRSLLPEPPRERG